MCVCCLLRGKHEQANQMPCIISVLQILTLQIHVTQMHNILGMMVKMYDRKKKQLTNI